MTDEVKKQADNKDDPEIVQAETTDHELHEPSQSNEQRETTDQTTFSSDEVAEQPTSMEDFYEKKERFKVPPSPTRICRECLQESFGGYESEIRGICQDHFKRVFRNLKEADRFDDIIVQLILHCEKHRQFELLWVIIKKYRPNSYKKYYRRWQKAVENMEIVDWLEQNQYKTASSRQRSEGKPHPLATENSVEINKWFFDELNKQEKSFVLTVALFEGMNRKLIGDLTHQIESRLFDTEQE